MNTPSPTVSIASLASTIYNDLRNQASDPVPGGRIARWVRVALRHRNLSWLPRAPTHH